MKIYKKHELKDKIEDLGVKIYFVLFQNKKIFSLYFSRHALWLLKEEQQPKHLTPKNNN